MKSSDVITFATLIVALTLTRPAIASREISLNPEITQICATALGEPTHVRHGVHFSKEDLTTRVYGSRVVISRGTGAAGAWRDFDTKLPVDMIELVAHVEKRGLRSEPKLMAIIVSGNQLYSVDLLRETPAVINRVEAKDRISSLRIYERVHRVREFVDNYGPSADVQIQGVLGVTTFLLAYDLSWVDGPEPTKSLSIAHSSGPVFDASDVEVLHDFTSVRVIRSGAAVYLASPDHQARLLLAPMTSDTKVTASHGIKGDSPDVTAVAVGTRAFLIHDARGSIWSTFETDGPINEIQLIELPVQKGSLMRSDTFAFAIQGATLSIFNVQGSPASLRGQVKFGQNITASEVTGNEAFVKFGDWAGTLESPILKVFVQGEATPISFRVHEGRLELYEIDGTTNSNVLSITVGAQPQISSK